VAATAAAAAALVAGPAASPAGADTGTVGAGSGGGTVTVGAGSGSGTGGAPGGTSGGASGGGSGGTSPWQCTYTYLALNNDGGFPAGGAEPGAWYSVTCVDASSGTQVTQTVWVTGTPAATVPQVDPRTLALQAEQSMVLPDPTPLSDPSGSSVVGLATWLWIDPAIWHARSVTATAGAVSATAVARPVDVVWALGDGAQVVCGGPGIAYDVALPSAWQSTYCSHTYSQSSLGQPSPDGDPDDGRFPVSVAVEWAVTWSAVGARGGGVLPTLTTSSGTSLRVVQIESLNAVPTAPLARRESITGGAS
jgi:hypothetical protein